MGEPMLKFFLSVTTAQPSVTPSIASLDDFAKAKTEKVEGYVLLLRRPLRCLLLFRREITC